MNLNLSYDREIDPNAPRYLLAFSATQGLLANKLVSADMRQHQQVDYMVKRIGVAYLLDAGERYTNSKLMVVADTRFKSSIVGSKVYEVLSDGVKDKVMTGSVHQILGEDKEAVLNTFLTTKTKSCHLFSTCCRG